MITNKDRNEKKVESQEEEKADIVNSKQAGKQNTALNTEKNKTSRGSPTLAKTLEREGKSQTEKLNNWLNLNRKRTLSSLEKDTNSETPAKKTNILKPTRLNFDNMTDTPQK